MKLYHFPSPDPQKVHFALLEPGDLARNRIAIKFVGGKPDEDAIARGEKALPDVIRIVEGQLTTSKWLVGNDFTLIDCAYASIMNFTEKAGFSFEEFPKVRAYRVYGRDPFSSGNGRKLPSSQDFSRDSNDQGC
jgi:glutathione S-transferase